MTLQDLLNRTRNSSFNQQGYTVTINMNERDRFLKSLMLYTDYTNYTNSKTEEDIYIEDFFTKSIPDFQRDNNKWSTEMKVKFVENLLSGVNTEIKLFRMDQDSDAQIIDGLQRLTAITDFMDSKFKVFGFSYDELKDTLSRFKTHFSISVYDFSDWAGVGKYYVDMNENITHSKEDIQKAKDWFLKEKNVVL